MATTGSSVRSPLRRLRGPLACLGAVTALTLLAAGCGDDTEDAEPLGDVEQPLPPGEFPPEALSAEPSAELLPTQPDPGDLAWTEVIPSGTSTPVYVVHDVAGIDYAPLPDWVRSELYEDLSEPAPTDEDVTYVIMNDQFLDDLSIAMSTGVYSEQLTVAQQAYQEQVQQEQAQQLPIDGESQVEDPQELLRCRTRTYTKQKVFPLSISASGSPSPTSGASFAVTGNVTGSITGEINYKVKSCFGIPYWVKLVHARAHGSLDAAANLSVTGSYSANLDWSQQIAKPYLGAIAFTVGPIPFFVGFNMPIDIGVKVGSAAQVSLNLQGASSQIHGSFDYTCTTGGCSGWKSFTSNGTGLPQSPTGSVSGRVDARVWVQPAVRAYLYGEGVLYLQVGVRPTLIGDLWGYYGNTCGDADGNGSNETVGALTLDLDWQGFLTAKASVLGSTVYRNDDLAHTSRANVRFWDLYPGGSTALAPLFRGPGSLWVNQVRSYSVQMRPCWPYTDNVSYLVTWGNGTTWSGTGAPQTPVSISKSFPSTGNYLASATAQGDTGGRTLGRSTTRSITVSTIISDPSPQIPIADLLPGQHAQGSTE